MSWLRNFLVFPDDAWELAAGKLNARFERGRWLANSEVKLTHGDIPITLRVEFSTHTDRHTQCTRAIPAVKLRPTVKLLFAPRLNGVAGALTGSLLSATGKEIQVPSLDEGYQVIGDNAELARRIFGDPGFLSKLKGMSTAPDVALGGRLSDWEQDDPAEEKDDVCVSVPAVVKDDRELVSLVDLTKTLLDLLKDNKCLE